MLKAETAAFTEAIVAVMVPAGMCHCWLTDSVDRNHFEDPKMFLLHCLLNKDENSCIVATATNKRLFSSLFMCKGLGVVVTPRTWDAVVCPEWWRWPSCSAARTCWPPPCWRPMSPTGTPATAGSARQAWLAPPLPLLLHQTTSPEKTEESLKNIFLNSIFFLQGVRAWSHDQLSPQLVIKLNSQ